MKIKSYKNFCFGIVVAISSFVPFSYMNHAEKFKIENCEKVSGILVQAKKLLQKEAADKTDGC